METSADLIDFLLDGRIVAKDINAIISEIEDSCPAIAELWGTEGRVCDYYSQELLWMYAQSSAKRTIVIYSVGFNKVNEKGEGDDFQFLFSSLPFVHQSKKMNHSGSQ